MEVGVYGGFFKKMALTYLECKAKIFDFASYNHFSGKTIKTRKTPKYGDIFDVSALCFVKKHRKYDVIIT